MDFNKISKQIFIQENESLRDRIERTLSKIKSFTNRKRQELHQSIDSGYGKELFDNHTMRKETMEYGE